MEIEIEGKKFTLDVKVATEKGCLKPVEVHQIGDLYRLYGQIYVLAQVSYNEVNLIDIQSGKRWNESIQLAQHTNPILRQVEWEQLVTVSSLGNIVKISHADAYELFKPCTY